MSKEGSTKIVNFTNRRKGVSVLGLDHIVQSEKELVFS